MRREKKPITIQADNTPVPIGTGGAQLQELYRHLDNVYTGDRYMAYYGQLRAEEHPHKLALEMTIDHFDLRSQRWYQKRFPG
jgi:hypothetical protein